MRIGKSRYVESNRTHCCIRKFNAALSLCGVLEVTLYFFEDFSVTKGLAVVEALNSDHSLLLGTKVQLVVSCTIVET